MACACTNRSLRPLTVPPDPKTVNKRIEGTRRRRQFMAMAQLTVQEQVFAKNTAALAANELYAANYQLHYARTALENMTGSYEQTQRDLLALQQETEQVKQSLEAANRDKQALVQALEAAHQQLQQVNEDKERIASAGNVNYKHYKSVELLLRQAKF